VSVEKTVRAKIFCRAIHNFRTAISGYQKKRKKREIEIKKKRKEKEMLVFFMSVKAIHAKRQR